MPVASNPTLLCRCGREGAELLTPKPVAVAVGNHRPGGLRASPRENEANSRMVNHLGGRVILDTKSQVYLGRGDGLPRYGKMSEWFKEGVCKTSGSAFGGSNPPLPISFPRGRVRSAITVTGS
jgi:hypothetical protein